TPSPTRPAPSTAPSPTTPASPVASGPGSRFTPVTPRRLLDTRTGQGLSGPVWVGDGGTVDLAVAGGSTGVPAGATAVVLNVTAVGATRATDVRVYPTPTDGRVPGVSNINLTARQTRAGLVTVPVGAGGRVRLRNEDGAVSLLADLAGWYAPDAETAFHPVAPVRLLDTRTQTIKKLGPGGSLDLVVAGARGVPTSASAVVLTVTGVAPTASTDLAVYPASASTAKPQTSNVNLVPGPPVPNLVVVQVGAGGKVRIRNSSGATAVLVDLSGWYDAAAAGGQLFRPVVPVRLFDTRQAADPARRRLGPGGRGVYRTTQGAEAVPTSASAVLLNVTGVAASAATDVRVYPFAAGDTFPVVSTLNLGAGRTAANAAVVRLGTDGDVVFRNQSGSVALLSDLAGWFGP
ncbi:MAG: N-acetylmuramoyl-L-alanine amidase, partial [Frankiales bacterium]|nr:N-acetylmuramoyl-L-alanine amidase [Frankiales bacterium]